MSAPGFPEGRRRSAPPAAALASALRRWLPLLCVAWLAACQTPPPHATLVRGEFTRLLADQQPPCGSVRDYTRHGRLDYSVACESGRVYRVRVDAEGRVLVTPHAPAAQ